MAKMHNLLVYNIRKKKFAKSPTASGVANRWNRKDEFVLYTAATISLAALECVAHRSAIDEQTGYVVMVFRLQITASDIQEMRCDRLPKNWQTLTAYRDEQEIGSEWYRAGKKLILKVPSVLVPSEFNYLINTTHADFNQKVIIEKREEFVWDRRLL